jgi:hypothetical protein
MDSNPDDYINLARSRQEQFQNYPASATFMSSI